MQTLGLFDVKNRFSEVCSGVHKTGEPCVVTRHGKPLVKIVPVSDDSEQTVWDRVEDARARYGASDDEELELPQRTPANNRKSPL